MRTVPLVLVAALLSAASPAVAAWSVDPGPNGLLVCQTGPDSYGAMSDGAGGAFIGWCAWGGGQSTGPMYLQRLDSQGALPWGANGVAATFGGGLIGQDFFGPSLCRDGTGGVVYLDGLHGQRFTSAGTTTWTPSWGISIGGQSSGQGFPWVAQDGTGSFVATWCEFGQYHFMAQRIDGDSNQIWGPVGIDLGFDINGPYAFAADGAGGLIAFWTMTGPLGDLDLRAQRFSSAGLALWGPGGVAVCAQPGNQGAFYNTDPNRTYSTIRAVSDGAGGACVVWFDTRSDVAGDVYAQRVDASGALQWADAGVPLCTAPGAENTRLAAVPDGSGGLIAAWEDERTSDGSTGFNLYAQRVGGDGVARWTADGVPLSNAAGDQRLFVADWATNCLAADGSGGAFAAWYTSGGGVSAQHLDGDGTPIWPIQGVAFSSAVAFDVSVVPDAQGGCVVLWETAPPSFPYPITLHARPSSAVVTGVGIPALSFRLSGVRPNPARGPFAIDFALAERGNVRLEVFDLAGRLVARQDAGELGPGPHQLQVASLPPGLYLVRVRQAGHSAATRAIVLR